MDASLPLGMRNDQGAVVDLYIPRKCSATGRLIPPEDHASVQINVAHLDQDGVFKGEFTTFALSGFVRSNADADAWMTELCAKKGLIKGL